MTTTMRLRHRLLLTGVLIACLGSGMVQCSAVLLALPSGEAEVAAPASPTPAPPSAAPPPSPTAAAPPTTAEPVPAEEAIVVKVTDGDTIRVQNLKGREYPVRVVGIDTPETKHPDKPVQCYGPEASAEANRLLKGRRVTVAPDAFSDDKDKYGRALRYVYSITVKDSSDEGDFGMFMIENGFAREYTFNKIEYDLQARYRDAEQRAKKDGKGLWGVRIDPKTHECLKPVTKPTPKSTPTEEPEPTEEPTEKPTSGPPQVYYENCTEVRNAGKAPIRRGEPGYRSGLDRDDDGVACET